MKSYANNHNFDTVSSSSESEVGSPQSDVSWSSEDRYKPSGTALPNANGSAATKNQTSSSGTTGNGPSGGNDTSDDAQTTGSAPASSAPAKPATRKHAPAKPTTAKPTTAKPAPASSDPANGATAAPANGVPAAPANGVPAAPANGVPAAPANGVPTAPANVAPAAPANVAPAAPANGVPAAPANGAPAAPANGVPAALANGVPAALANGAPAAPANGATAAPANGAPAVPASGALAAPASGAPASSASAKQLPSLTDPGSGYPAATEAIKYLIQAVGRDVVSFRRNTHVSYMIVERARDLVSAINRYIENVESSADGDWDSFFKFTAAIEPLEDILFQLLSFTDSEKKGYLASTVSIEECVSSAERWAANRELLSKALNDVDTHQVLAGLSGQPQIDSHKDREEARAYDDKTLLQEIRDTIKTSLTNVRFPSYVKKVKTSLDKLQSKVIKGSPPEWLTVITVKTSMLVQGVLEILRTSAVGSDLMKHLRSKEVWLAALKLIEALEGVDENQPALPRDASDNYDTFLATLTKLNNCTVPLPPSYLDLMKKAGRIHKPFQAQAFAFVMLCRFLADQFTGIAESALTADNIASLEEAFNETLNALKAAEGAVTTLQTFDVTNFTQHDIVQKFGNAEFLIQETFKSFKLDAQWKGKQAELHAALEKDIDRMAKLNDIFRKSPNSTSAKAKVTVSIHDKGGAHLGTASVEEEITMRLQALRWSVAGALEGENVKRARTTGTFQRQTSEGLSEIPTTHETLADIADGQQQVNLRLVLS